jgi:hypothetical protein
VVVIDIEGQITTLNTLVEQLERQVASQAAQIRALLEIMGRHSKQLFDLEEINEVEETDTTRHELRIRKLEDALIRTQE